MEKNNTKQKKQLTKRLQRCGKLAPVLLTIFYFIVNKNCRFKINGNNSKSKTIRHFAGYRLFLIFG
jgi:hypothetical protein